MADLFYLMGASGVGKDSLLQYARRHLPGNHPVLFAHRYITRAAETQGENHIALSKAEFLKRNELGCFAMCWYCHSNWYGVGVEINLWLSMGLSVVVNGSRAYLEQALADYSELIPVLITADQQRLQARLTARARETSTEIGQRLARTQRLSEQLDHPKLVRIANNHSLNDAGECLVQLLQGVQLQA
jgi:ribose 1,5-bisphosphokinase